MKKNLTFQQELLLDEFVESYGLSPEQISFDGEKAEPIFDFDALCLLREKLTDFKAVEVSQVSFDNELNEAKAICVIVKKDSNLITVSDFALLGEGMPDGTTIQNSMQAKRVARARAMRTGIRAAGVNLLAAHRAYLENGEILDFQPIDPRLNRYKENHKLAEEIGFIAGSDKSEYEKHIADMFDGRTSSKDLDDDELQKLSVSLRAIRRVKFATIAAKQAA